ncbi:hypothetical protein ABZ914_23290 [Spirillospora sp. NPDC046719]
MVAYDHGQDVALRVARRLVIYLKRPGGQSWFNASLDRVATVMGRAVVRNRAGDGVLIKDFTEPDGLHVLRRMLVLLAALLESRVRPCPAMVGSLRAGPEPCPVPGLALRGRLFQALCRAALTASIRGRAARVLSLD